MSFCRTDGHMGVKYTENINGVIFLVAEINAAKCATYKGFVDEMRSCFDFPYGDFRSMNILGECMRDLAWLKERNFMLRIKNMVVLERKSAARSSFFVECLTDYKTHWDEQKVRVKKSDENNFIIEYL